MNNLPGNHSNGNGNGHVELPVLHNGTDQMSCNSTFNPGNWSSSASTMEMTLASPSVGTQASTNSPFDPSKMDMDVPAVPAEYHIEEDPSVWDSPFALIQFAEMLEDAGIAFEHEEKNEDTIPSAMQAPTRPSTPPINHIKIDETYRQDISDKLNPVVKNDSLPSVEYLNLCVKMFFLKFNKVFPLLHMSTFRSAADNAYLLLSICSIGSLFIGTDNAVLHGIKIFERLNKSLLAKVRDRGYIFNDLVLTMKWESILESNRELETISIVQAAIIGQTFAMLSGSPKHWDIAEAFMGTVVLWARKIKIWNRPEYVVNQENLKGPKLDEEWRAWARQQEACRVGLCLRVHDAELTQRFHHDPLLRHDLRRIPHSCPSDLFTAPTAKAWAKLYLKNLEIEKQMSDGEEDSNDSNDNDDNDNDNDEIKDEKSNKDYDSMYISRFPNYPLKTAEFSSYCVLEGIGASVCEYVNLDDLDENAIVDFTEDLIIWRNSVFGQDEKYSDPLCLMVLWHGIFVNIFANLDLIERAIGRDGKEDSLKSRPLIEKWSKTENAKHCAVHCLLLFKLLERTRLGSEPAIHVPRCLYQALIAWYCYNKFTDTPDFKHILVYDEIEYFSTHSTLQIYGINNFEELLPEVDMWTNFAHLLRRLEPWGISKRLANNVLSLIESEGGELLESM